MTTHITTYSLNDILDQDSYLQALQHKIDNLTCNLEFEQSVLYWLDECLKTHNYEQANIIFSHVIKIGLASETYSENIKASRNLGAWYAEQTQKYPDFDWINIMSQQNLSVRQRYTVKMESYTRHSPTEDKYTTPAMLIPITYLKNHIDAQAGFFDKRFELAVKETLTCLLQTKQIDIFIKLCGVLGKHGLPVESTSGISKVSDKLGKHTVDLGTWLGELFIKTPFDDSFDLKYAIATFPFRTQGSYVKYLLDVQSNLIYDVPLTAWYAYSISYSIKNLPEELKESIRLSFSQLLKHQPYAPMHAALGLRELTIPIILDEIMFKYKNLNATGTWWDDKPISIHARFLTYRLGSMMDQHVLWQMGYTLEHITLIADAYKKYTPPLKEKDWHDILRGIRHNYKKQCYNIK